LKRWAKKGVTLLIGLIDLNYQGPKTGVQVQNGGKDHYMQSKGHCLLGHLLVLPHPMLGSMES
jgi:dUTPase